MTKRISCVAGRHCIEDAELGVEEVMILLRAGMSVGDVENKFPDLEEEDIKACVRYYLDKVQ